MGSENLKYKFYYDRTELNKCLLCYDPECTKACRKGADPGGIIRSLFFRNYLGASKKITCECEACDAPCERACVLAKNGRPVSIRTLLSCVKNGASSLPVHKIESVDVSSEICGVKLENPFLLSSSVVASSYDTCRRAFEAGWAGAVFKTVCCFPQHEASPRLSAIRHHSNSFFGLKNIEQLYDHGAEEAEKIFKRLKAEFPEKVIVASIMGRNEDEWTKLAGKCERAGASVIECNFSCPNMEDEKLGATIGQSEELVERFTRAARKGTGLPLLVKLTPNVTDMVPFAAAAKRGGADGISAINTINSISGVDIDTLVAEPSVHGRSIVGGYSGAAVKPIALRFISDLSRSDELKGMHFSGIGGVENWFDALEYVLLGARSVQITTAVMQYGYGIIDDLVSGVEEYLKCKGIASLKDMVGAAAGTVVDRDSLERDTVTFPVFDRELCCGCGRCYISCMDGGHQAIRFDKDTRTPHLIGTKCAGCHLCILVCPEKAIKVSDKAVRVLKN